MFGGSLQELDVRLSFDLAKGERDFLDRRKERASFTLRRLLGLPKKPRKNEVGNSPFRAIRQAYNQGKE